MTASAFKAVVQNVMDANLTYAQASSMLYLLLGGLEASAASCGITTEQAAKCIEMAKATAIRTNPVTP